MQIFAPNTELQGNPLQINYNRIPNGNSIFHFNLCFSLLILIFYHFDATFA